MKRLLLTGGSGFLGSRLTQIASASGEWQTFPTYFANPIDHPNGLRLDLRDRAAVEKTIRHLRPDVIIHQAVSNRNDDHVAAIVPAARHIMDAAIDGHIRLIHVSTDLVFDGRNPPYTDDAPVAPVNPYGAAKAFAEGLLMSAMPDEVLIVRPSLIYGFDPIDKQTGWLVEGIRRGETVRLFTDEFRCPIWVDTLSHALLELAASPHVGRLNLGGPPLNRRDFGMKMLACLGIDPGPNVVAAAIAESGLNRPADLTLDVSKARRWLRTKLLTVEESFEAFHRQRPVRF
jgi:dTDP-4-dehydrorhamnose reductase